MWENHTKAQTSTVKCDNKIKMNSHQKIYLVNLLYTLIIAYSVRILKDVLLWRPRPVGYRQDYWTCTASMSSQLLAQKNNNTLNIRKVE